MSNAQHNHSAEHTEGHSEEHSGGIRTPRQLITVVVLSFIVPIVVIMLLVHFVTSGTKTNAGSDAFTPESVQARIAPVAKFELVDANAPRVFQTGEAVFKAVCTTCHTPGAAGAPKIGDKAAWGPRMAEGLDAMFNIALKGKGAMPAKGGNPDLDDFEVKRAVVYMANNSGGSFKEPEAPKPAAPADAPADQAAPAPAAAAPAAAAPAPVAAAAPAAAPAAPAATGDGKKLYDTTCFACHGTGAAGAPKLGDKAAWGPRIATGLDTLVNAAIKGMGAMPPKGGNASASDADVRAAVQYMVDAAK